jgi:hypothetical protein
MNIKEEEVLIEKLSLNRKLNMSQARFRIITLSFIQEEKYHETQNIQEQLDAHNRTNYASGPDGNSSG